jgi:hypothetical protein
MATPYITATMLLSRPAGLAWNVVPTLTADSAAQQAQLQQVCWTATSIVDTYCHQPLRAVAVNQQDNGPGTGGRVAVDRRTCRASVITRQWPVTAVNAIQYSQATSFPETWALVPAGQYRIRKPVLQPAAGIPVTAPSGGNVIDIAPGYVTWDYGRGGWDVLTSYTSGWPHAGLTALAAEGAQTLTVDDVTGWAGWTGWLYDSTATELVTVTAAAAASPVQLPGVAGTVQAGPGTLTLAAPLAYAHQAGTVISALPGDALHAAALAAAVQALETIDAIAAQSLTTSLAGGTGALAEQYELLLDNFMAVA